MAETMSEKRRSGPYCCRRYGAEMKLPRLYFPTCTARSNCAAETSKDVASENEEDRDDIFAGFDIYKIIENDLKTTYPELEEILNKVIEANEILEQDDILFVDFDEENILARILTKVHLRVIRTLSGFIFELSNFPCPPLY
ncbi:hypothetical protein ACJMK2_012235 [Sinanodonta woodiana]|uniref:Uncharacterized protein n=1 Tax=Sinanodonta woodiana TaxID=1069815 RepID=A0ABD3V7K4_SINWO